MLLVSKSQHLRLCQLKLQLHVNLSDVTFQRAFSREAECKVIYFTDNICDCKDKPLTELFFLLLRSNHHPFWFLLQLLHGWLLQPHTRPIDVYCWLDTCWAKSVISCLIQAPLRTESRRSRVVSMYTVMPVYSERTCDYTSEPSLCKKKTQTVSKLRMN